MESIAEQRLVRTLRGVLARVPVGDSIDDSEGYREVLTMLEAFVPELLRAVHREWSRESLDGICSTISRKTCDYELEIIGLCILLSDQTVTPIHVRLEISPDEDKSVWLEVMLGEMGANGMVRVPYGSTRVSKLELANADRIKTIEWVYHIGFGERSQRSAP